MKFKKDIFPNTSTVAYYDSFGQYINLSKYDEAESLEKLNSRIKNDEYIEFICTINHELQHWEDHISTVWGLENLIKIYNALNCKLNNNENEFWRINSLMKDLKRSSFSDYYHVSFRESKFQGIENRWRWEVSTGFKFDYNGLIDNNSPILFIRFYNSENIPVSRTPISIHSFLETNAMFKELTIQGGHVHSLKSDIVEYHIKERELKNKSLNWLYNSDLTVYSVVSHAVSNILGINDIVETMNIASILSTFILNFPSSFYDTVPINKQLGGLSDRGERLVAQKDKGFVFLNLLFNYQEIYTKEKNFNVNSLLKASNLPNISEVEQEVKKETENLFSTIIDGPFRVKVENYFTQGVNLLEKRGVFNQTQIDYDYLISQNFLPNILWGDSYYDLDTIPENEIMYKIHHGINLSFWEWYKFEKHMSMQFEVFNNICGI